MANELIEKDINLSVSLKLRDILLRCGFEVIMAREDDSTVSMDDGIDLANVSGSDYFISIHHNAGGGDGSEVYHSIIGGAGSELAKRIGDEFAALGQNIRYVGTKEGEWGDYYFEIRAAWMPAVIVEFAFLDSIDHEIIDEDIEQLSEAVAIAKGICRHVGVDYIEEQKSTDWRDILRAKLDEPDKWIKAVEAAIADSDLGDLEIIKYLPELIMKIGGD